MMVTFYRLRFFIFVSRLPWQLHYLYMYVPSNKFTVSCCFYARVYLCMECKKSVTTIGDPCIKFLFLHEIGIPYHFFTRRNHFFVVCNIRFLLTVFVGKKCFTSDFPYWKFRSQLNYCLWQYKCTICRYHLFNEDHEINTCFFLDRPQLSVRKYNARMYTKLDEIDLL